MRLKTLLPLVALGALCAGCFFCYGVRNLVEAPLNVADEWCMCHRNKRLAWAAAVTFLALNGVAVREVDVDAAEAFMLAVAGGTLTEVSQIEARLRYLYGSPITG